MSDEFRDLEPSAQDRTWAMAAHLLTFCGYVVPFGNIIGPLILWLLKRDESPFLDHHGREAINFQISVLIYVLVCIVLAFVLVGFFLLIALTIFDLVVTIVAAVRANEGRHYQYPLCIRFI